MPKLARSDLYSLEQYAELRNDFRKKLIAHKETRRVEIGEHLVMLFEDKLTMQYQIQEILKAEKIFEAAGIEEELEAYNPLIPDGDNWKATMMIQYDDIEERREMLGKLIGIEDVTYMQAEGFDKVYAIADEDLPRDDETKTSAVHFLRFQLNADMIKAIKQGAAIKAGSEHELYRFTTTVPDAVRESLAKDLE